MDARKKLMGLGPVEAEILEVLWKNEEMKVRDIHAKLKKKVAQSSVAVLLDRLFDRRLVTRRTETGRGGLFYIYSASVTRPEFEKHVVEQTVDNLLKHFGPTAVNYFNERFRK